MLQFPHTQQECPVCGRPVRVRDELVGHWVSCEHCSGTFVALEFIPRSGRYQNRVALNQSDLLLRRADQLLTMCGARLGQSGSPENQATQIEHSRYGSW